MEDMQQEGDRVHYLRVSPYVPRSEFDNDGKCLDNYAMDPGLGLI